MCTKTHAQHEIEQIKKYLTDHGITYTENEGGMIRFPNTAGDCYVVPSQTYDGLLYVRYSAAGRCDTAEQALHLCGVKI